MSTESFPGVKRPGRDADHPPPSRAKVEGRVEPYLCSPSGPSWPVIGRPLPLPLPQTGTQSFETSITVHSRHNVTSQKTLILIDIIVRTSNLSRSVACNKHMHLSFQIFNEYTQQFQFLSINSTVNILRWQFICMPTWYHRLLCQAETLGGAVGWSVAGVRFLIVPLEFFIHFTLPAAQW